jgi:hypothetical protein
MRLDTSVANFIVYDFGDKVDSSKKKKKMVVVRAVRLHTVLNRLAGCYDNPMPWSTVSPI